MELGYKDFFRDIKESREGDTFKVSGIAPDNIRYHGEGGSPLFAIKELIRHGLPTKLMQSRCVPPKDCGMDFSGHNHIVVWDNRREWRVELTPAKKAGKGVVYVNGTDIYAMREEGKRVDTQLWLGRYDDSDQLYDYDFRIVMPDLTYPQQQELCKEALFGAMLSLEFSFGDPSQSFRFH